MPFLWHPRFPTVRYIKGDPCHSFLGYLRRPRCVPSMASAAPSAPSEATPPPSVSTETFKRRKVSTIKVTNNLATPSSSVRRSLCADFSQAHARSSTPGLRRLVLSKISDEEDEEEEGGGGVDNATIDPQWRSLRVTPTELCLDLTLPTGQSFRWKLTGESEYTGVVDQYLVSLRQTDNDIEYFLHNSPHTDKAEVALRDYFSLSTSLKDVWELFIAADGRFAALAPHMAGARLLCQHPVECTFQFICSSNNHIQRISRMVDHLASLGPYLGTVQGIPFHAFPSLDALSRVTEAQLREAGFGYRAKYIVGGVKELQAKEGGGEQWLLSLRGGHLNEVLSELCSLPGIGPKVAACIALFSLEQHQAIPVDTHVWQIATTYIMPELSGERLTPKMHTAVSDAFARRFGKYAGWAQNVLFIAELSSHQSFLPEHLRRARETKVVRERRKKVKTHEDILSAISSIEG